MRELISVEASLDAEGALLPRAFLWRGRRHIVHSHGRRWQEAGAIHFLVQDHRQRTFELALEPAEGRWILLRSPGDFGVRRPKRAV